VLSAGHSEIGLWAASSASEPLVYPAATAAMIVFPVPLAAPLGEEGVQFVDRAETVKAGTARSTTIKTRCGTAGTLAHPTAEPGFLCVYAGLEQLYDLHVDGEPEEGARNGGLHAIDNVFASPGAVITGASILFTVQHTRNEEEEELELFPNIRVQGTWAVSAA
jgi:hypothetical protein